MKRKIRQTVRKARRWVGAVLRSTAELVRPSEMDEQPKFVYELAISNAGRLDERVALVTGGGGSIGSAVCYRLALEGATVGVAGRTPSTLDATIAQITSAGVPSGKVVPVILDVTDTTSVSGAVQKFVDDYGRLDILVNNAGGSARGMTLPLEEQDLDVIEEIISLNLTGTIRCCKYVIPHLKHVRGRIINFGSTVGLNGQRFFAEYSASKSGVIGLTKSLALELGEFGTTVNMVTPGWVWRNSFDGQATRASDKTALGRYGTADEVAGLVAYLCTDEAGYLTGNDLKVDGGRTLGLMKE